MSVIKREGKADCIVAGMAVGDMKQKEYDDKTFYEVGVGVGNEQIINVAIWNRKPIQISKYDRVLAVGQLKATTKEDKTYYSLNADFITKETAEGFEIKQKEELAEIDDDSLPF